MTTISASSTIGIYLSTPTYTNPVVIDPGVSISNTARGLYANTGNWTVENNGTISAVRTSGYGGIGVALYSGGTFFNATSASVYGSARGLALDSTATDGVAVNYGTISGKNFGVFVFQSATVTNGASGLIIGRADGVLMEDLSGAGVGTVVNAGRIVASVSAYAGAALAVVGGVITNTSSASIFGAHDGISMREHAGTVFNFGGITAAVSLGVYLEAGGVVTNAASASIMGGDDGIRFGSGSAGTVINYGSVNGGVTGEALFGGGSVTNGTGGTISAYESGVYAKGDPTTVTNAGQILTTGSHTAVLLEASGNVTNRFGGTIIGGSGVTGSGVRLNAGGSVSNAASASITGAVDGVAIYGGAGTIANAGRIQGTVGAVLFADNYNNALIVYPGAAFVGVVSGGNTIGATAISTLELASATNAGTLSGLGTKYIDFAQVTVDAGADWTLTGSNTNPVGETVNDNGTLVLGASLLNGGSITGGVRLATGASLNNSSSGVISNISHPAIYAPGSSAGVSVINYGMIINSGITKSAIGLHGGGFVSNAVTGTISASGDPAVYLSGLPGTVSNAGVIVTTQTHASVALYAGGSVTNVGTIAGGATSVFVKNAAGTVSNSGLMNQVYLGDGGSVTNLTNGTIIGTVIGGTANVSGVYINGSAGSVTNYGLITNAAGGYAINLRLGGTLINCGPTASQPAGTIASSRGILVQAGAGTLVNAGTISGSDGTAVRFLEAGFADRIVVDPGAAFLGAVDGENAFGSTIVSTLEFAPGASDGALSGIGTQITNFWSITFDTGAHWFVAGNTTGLAVTISGFAQGDTIEVNGFVATGDTFTGAGLVLGSTGGSTTIGIQGAFTTGDFNVTTSPSNSYVELQTVCFVRGTQIATVNGEVPVERLAVGDTVVTHDGKAEPVVWIGKGRVLVTPGRRSAATPVIVRRGALGDNVPHRDLRVTKGHSLYLDGALIPVEELINHRSIVWDDRTREAEIYHVELARHVVLIADGAPAESYRDDGNRWLFQNANAAWSLPPQEPCTPVLTGGPLVNAVWRRLIDRAGPRPGLPLTDDPDLHLIDRGKRIDALDRRADGAYMFRVIAPLGKIRLCSRVAVPQELGIARDPRRLGVAVRRLVMAQRNRQRVVTADAATLTDGYHDFEPAEGIRWTCGDAAVPAGLLSGIHGPAILIVELGGSTQYVDDGMIRRVA